MDAPTDHFDGIEVHLFNWIARIFSDAFIQDKQCITGTWILIYEFLNQALMTSITKAAKKLNSKNDEAAADEDDEFSTQRNSREVER